MDRRLLASNGHVAASELQGQVDADHFVAGEVRQIGQPVVDLCRDASCLVRERQLIMGEQFRVLDVSDDVAFGVALRDGYVGYLANDALCEPVAATHIVCVRASHLYEKGDLKSPDLCSVTFGSRLRVVGAEAEFFETHTGAFIPKPHLRPANAPLRDPASVAQLFFGTPYLWGGNSGFGIDCSGLVQASLLTCGIACPGDSDMQQDQVGHVLDVSDETQRGDLFFWKGHVAMAVDDATLIHANAHSMSVAYEPVRVAIDRIADQAGGPVIMRKRV